MPAIASFIGRWLLNSSVYDGNNGSPEKSGQARAVGPIETANRTGISVQEVRQGSPAGFADEITAPLESI